MDYFKVIAELVEEKQKLDRLIGVLEGLQNANRESRTTVSTAKRRGRKFMGAEERQRVSERMKKYWAARNGAPENQPSATSNSSTEIEDNLRNQMLDARRIFDTASHEFDKLIQISADCAGSADGHIARGQAKKIRTDAYRVYSTALRRYTDYIVDGKSR